MLVALSACCLLHNYPYAVLMFASLCGWMKGCLLCVLMVCLLLMTLQWWPAVIAIPFPLWTATAIAPNNSFLSSAGDHNDWYSEQANIMLSSTFSPFLVIPPNVSITNGMNSACKLIANWRYLSDLACSAEKVAPNVRFAAAEMWDGHSGWVTQTSRR